ncbi:MAG: peptide ABC transporter ATP-binding protein, partial [Alphaproteobacteria bacterium]|nr:peptide ABC transporter ATP-binding protein [Alphaproteobacteria bacterium]
LEGDMPSAMKPPPGCAFHTRCPVATAACRGAVPPLRAMPDGHEVACHRVTTGADGAPVAPL